MSNIEVLGTDTNGVINESTSGDVYGLISGYNYRNRDMTNGYLYTKVLTDKVGIGVVAPSEALEISGNVYVNANTDNKGFVLDRGGNKEY